MYNDLWAKLRHSHSSSEKSKATSLKVNRPCNGKLPTWYWTKMFFYLKKEVIKISFFCCVWWQTPLISALGRQRQADFWVQGQPGLQSEFQDRIARAAQGNPVSEKQNKTKKNQNNNNKKISFFDADEEGKYWRINVFWKCDWDVSEDTNGCSSTDNLQNDLL